MDSPPPTPSSTYTRQQKQPQHTNQQKKPQEEHQRYSTFVPASSPPQDKPNPQNTPTLTNLFDQKINQAIKLKNSGNAYFKNRDYIQAIKQYSSALKILDPSYFYGATRAQCQKMSQLSSNLLCNMGFCYFNTNDMQRCQIFLSQAIVINPKYAKALHKRALARYELGKYEEAFEDVKLAFNLDKSSTEIHASYSKILQKYNQQIKINKQKMKQLSAKMFNNSASKSSASASAKKNNNQNTASDSNVNKVQEKQSWSWPSLITFAGAAAFIGVGIYKILKK